MIGARGTHIEDLAFVRYNVKASKAAIGDSEPTKKTFYIFHFKSNSL